MKDGKAISTAPARLLPSRDYVDELRAILERLDYAMIDRFTEAIWRGYEQGRTLFIFGNGGSAALASHLATDMGKGTVAGERARLRVISLTDNVPLMTAWANDFGYDNIFAEQLRGLVQRGDLAFAISGSGNSKNVVLGIEAAREAGATAMVLTGFDGGRVKELCELCLVVPSNNMQHVEDAHLCAAHAIFTAVRERMMRASGE
ncbi:MAG TPA: SIS domain-containing protein [Candidatus Acidoferrales bacterium]|nr:SIS domain-containing protein [Candidatus Acidoferrales bacterium]